jgi:hypothetical protein
MQYSIRGSLENLTLACGHLMSWGVEFHSGRGIIMTHFLQDTTKIDQVLNLLPRLVPVTVSAN